MLNGTGYAEYANVSSTTGVIISKGLATLHELETVYSYEDALNIAEIIAVNNYNEWVAMNNARPK